MIVVIKDGWIPVRYFDDYAEAHKYASECNRNYLGHYIIRTCTDDYPRRFDKAILKVGENYNETIK